MYNYTALGGFYTALWMILLIVSVILFICKIIFRRLGKTALSQKVGTHIEALSHSISN